MPQIESNGEKLLLLPFNPEDLLSRSPCVVGVECACTADHPIFSVDSGYQPAGSLVSGQTVIALTQVHALSNVLGTSDPARSVPRVLREGTHNSCIAWCAQIAGANSCGRGMLSKSRLRLHCVDIVLLGRVFSAAPQHEEPSQVSSVREASGEAYRKYCEACRPSRKEICSVLRTSLALSAGSVSSEDSRTAYCGKACQNAAHSNAHAGAGQQPLQDGNQLCRLVPQNATGNPGARWRLLQRLWGAERTYRDAQDTNQTGQSSGVSPDDTPYRLRSEEQCGSELDFPLRCMPQVSPSHCGCWTADTVSSVRQCGDLSQFIYDIQVEGNRNFFANGILVHNCGIVDDPVNGMGEARSERYRRETWMVDGTWIAGRSRARRRW